MAEALQQVTGPYSDETRKDKTREREEKKEAKWKRTKQKKESQLCDTAISLRAQAASVVDSSRRVSYNFLDLIGFAYSL